MIVLKIATITMLTMALVASIIGIFTAVAVMNVQQAGAAAVKDVHISNLDIRMCL